MTNSDIHTMKQQNFKRPSRMEWQEAAEASLKGKPLDSLHTETLENITLRPLYTDAALPINHVRPSHSQWITAQPSSGRTGQEWLEAMTDSLKKGNESIYIDGRRAIAWDEPSLRKLGELMVTYPIAFIHIESGDRLLEVFDQIKQSDRDSVSGVILSKQFDLPDGYPYVRTIGIDLESVHMKGADSVTELALALAEAAERASEMKDFEQFSSEVFFRFPADTHFFMEISKFRAFRSLWKLFCSAYRKETADSVPLMGFTSLRSFSKIDPYVNLLRAGNSAFSAILGGVDWLTVHPYNELTGDTAQALRYARNTQLIIREETHAGKVADPSGGSYFIEHLTVELVQNAWNLFLEIEEMGGKDAYLQSGRLEQLSNRRNKQVATAQNSLIGTNVYANSDDWDMGDNLSHAEKERPAYVFEELRKKAADQSINAVLIPFGKLKEYKPRADFVTGFLAAGGITVRQSPAFETGSEAAEWLAKERPDYAVVVASPEQTEQVATEIGAGKPVGVILDIAGRVREELTLDWLAAGIDGFVFSGQNRTQKIAQILDSCKEAKTNEKA